MSLALNNINHFDNKKQTKLTILIKHSIILMILNKKHMIWVLNNINNSK